MASTWTIMVLVNSDHFVELKYGLHFEIESIFVQKLVFEFLKWEIHFCLRSKRMNSMDGIYEHATFEQDQIKNANSV